MKRLVVIGLLCLCSWPHAVSAAGSYVWRQETADGHYRYQEVNGSRGRLLRAAVPNQVFTNHAYHALYTPNDPEYALQWDAQVINLPSAWDAAGATPFLGRPEVVVAVLDTGIAAGYANPVSPDLTPSTIWTNVGEIAADGIDNDGNGFVDDVHGWDFVNNDNVPADDHGHGTHIAAIIGASTNNNVATAGIAPNVTILPIKVLNQTGDGTTLTITEAVQYAVASGATIINLSLGGNEGDEVLHAALKQAGQAGVLIVAASGNEGQSNLNYPAVYDEVIAVTASQYDGTRAPYGNWGTGLDLSAPGGNIAVDQNGDGRVDGIAQITCTPGDCSNFGLYYYTGTSQAAAHVSGVAALVASCVVIQGQNPRTLNSSIRSNLISTALDLGVPGYDTQSGYGLVQAQAALSAAGCASSSPTAPQHLNVAARANLPALSSQRAYPYAAPFFSWSGPAGSTYSIQWGKQGGPMTTSTQTATTFQPTLTKSGTYILSVTTINADTASPAAIATYTYRPAQILVSNGAATAIYSAKGKSIRVISSAGKNTTTSVGASFSSATDDRYLVARGGIITVYRSNGQKLNTLKPFGKSYTQPLSAAIVHRLNQDPLIVSAMTGGSEVRISTVAGGSVRRMIIANGKAHGLLVASGDVDGDGTEEFIVADRNGPAVRVYRADGTTMAAVNPSGKAYTAGWSLTAGDINADGRADIIIGARRTGVSPTFLVLDATGHKTKSIKLVGLAITPLTEITAVDLDGNGRDDLAVLTPGQSTVTVWTERGTKRQSITVPKSSSPQSIGALQ